MFFKKGVILFEIHAEVITDKMLSRIYPQIIYEQGENGHKHR